MQVPVQQSNAGPIQSLQQPRTPTRCREVAVWGRRHARNAQRATATASTATDPRDASHADSRCAARRDERERLVCPGPACLLPGRPPALSGEPRAFMMSVVAQAFT